MLRKIAFVMIIVSGVTAIIDTSRLFKNSAPVLQKRMPNQFAACCPQVSLTPPGSQMGPLSDYGAYISLIVDFGNCTNAIANNSTFICCAEWDDGKDPNCITYNKLGGCHMANQYPKEDKTYTITATYCNALEQTDFCCTSLTRTVPVGSG